MADIELVIKIPEGLYNDIKSLPFTTFAEDIIINGTPLEKHDEEVIKETVESIWGKPPYTEMLDKVRAEIQKLRNCSCSNSDGIVDDVEDILDKYKAESEEV